ncbi:hypothetical protein FRX31_022295 [Thalictrum thalictroides]|uniref:Uncharacterized protein n=1 Tax=Thalictrum thalictroides TaxID=46969 RepID=A0A7J6VTR4_THATH|nr:hypothetical protein FRX31_022295 [Thalictrum thalictroides]
MEYFLGKVLGKYHFVLEDFGFCSIKLELIDCFYNCSTSISSSNLPSDNVSTSTVERLPDASMLLNSPAFSSHQMSGSDHYSRVSAAMAESASRKRESNGTLSSHQRNKFPRSNLPHSRNLPETVGGLLVPPQLSGRSNVVTEDLGRLFARRNVNPSPHRSSEQLS